MRQINLYYFITNGKRYEIDKATYNKIKVNDLIEIHYSKYSLTFLEYKLCEEKTDK